MSIHQKPQTNRAVKLYCKSEFLVEREILKLKKSLPHHKVYEFDASSECDTFIQCATTHVPFFKEKRLFILKDAHKLKKSSVLDAFIQNGIDADTFVLFVEGQKGKATKYFTELPVPSKDIEVPSSYKIPEWLIQEARDRGKVLSKHLASAIVLNVGDDLSLLSQELDKIVLYADDNKTHLDSSDVVAVIYGHSELSPFDIIQYWISNEREMAVQYLFHHLSKVPKNEIVRSNLVLINNLLSRVENQIIAKSLYESGRSDHDIAKTIGLGTWLYQNKMKPTLKLRSTKNLIKAFHKLCDIEKALKSGNERASLALQNFIIQH